MTSEIDSDKYPSGVTMRRIENESYDECFITAVAPEGTREDGLFDGVARLVAEQGVQPIQELIYGSESCQETVLAERKNAYRAAGLDPSTPATFVEGRPISQNGLAGVRLWGIRPRIGAKCSIKTVEVPGLARGRLWEDGSFRLLYLSDVRGSDETGALPEPAPSQAEWMFRNTERALKSHGFVYSNIVRTWIHLRDILDWYEDFNRVRNRLHAEKAFFGSFDEPVYPASTGIEAGAPGAQCAMDSLAVTGDVDIGPVLESARQGRSISYRSAFSRGMFVGRGAKRTIHVSGTASIDVEGRSVHPGDPERQSRQTLLSVAAILEKYGGRLEDICSATLYCKDPRAYAAYRKAASSMNASTIPAVPVLADICRPELLVELEAVACVSRK